jgi:alkylation response protein AidB-like acyl-CoA dehydrogenase
MVLTGVAAGGVVGLASEARAAVRELLEEWRSAGRFVPRCDAWSRHADPAFSAALGDRGLIGVSWPTPFGAGASYLVRLAVTEELLRAGAPVAAHWVGDRQIAPSLLRHGSPALQEEFLPAIKDCRARFCLGMSEPEAGSDLAAVATRAVQCAGGWRLTGRKIWTTGAHWSTHIYVLARTTPRDQVPRRHDGLSEFLVDLDTDGVAVHPILDLAGQHHFNEVTFDEVFVPGDRLLGVVDGGWAQVTAQLAFERGGPERVLSTYPLLARAMAHPVVAADPALCGQLGRLLARLTVLRRLCAELALAMDAGAAPVVQAATCKFLGTKFEHDVLALGRAAVGAGAEELRAEVDAAQLAAPGFGIRGGAAEVLLSIITKQEAA